MNADVYLASPEEEQCITTPESAAGQTLRAVGLAFEEMLVGAGASISSMPSSEIYTAMQQNVLDGADISSGSRVSCRIHEVSQCLTEPGENALWFMYEPILMWKTSFDRLSEEQQQALMEARQKAEDFFAEEAENLDEERVEVYREAGVEVVEMSQENCDPWLEIARRPPTRTSPRRC